jgi:hypothetical protein
LAQVPAIGLPFDELAGQGIEQFIAEGDAGQWLCREFGGVGEVAHARRKGLEGGALRGLQARQWLGDGIFQGGKGCRVELAQGPENVRGKRAIVGATLDKPPRLRPAGVLPPPAKAPCQQLAKQRPHAHTGEKIPAAPDLAGIPRVVAEFRVV